MNVLHVVLLLEVSHFGYVIITNFLSYPRAVRVLYALDFFSYTILLVTLRCFRCIHSSIHLSRRREANACARVHDDETVWKRLFSTCLLHFHALNNRGIERDDSIFVFFSARARVDEEDVHLKSQHLLV